MLKFHSLVKNEPVLKRRYWGDYNKLKREKDWMEAHFIINTSKMALYKNGKLYWPGKKHEHVYGQCCMYCGKKFHGVVCKDGKLFGVRIFVESLSGGDRKMHFLCSKKCYDSIRAYKKRNPNPSYIINKFAS